VTARPEYVVRAARVLLETHGFVVTPTDTAFLPHVVEEAPPSAAAPVGWLELFRATLTQGLQTGGGSLGEVARQLTVSSRTLQRQLAAHGTTFRAETNDARRELAGWLTRVGASNAQIALRLGYSDTRALRRAAQRWRHMSESGAARS
jgi:AraC-like DNA-binding protein